MSLARRTFTQLICSESQIWSNIERGLTAPNRRDQNLSETIADPKLPAPAINLARATTPPPFWAYGPGISGPH